MRIGVYNESSAGMLGGAEYEAAVLADDLSRDHEVEFVHHHEGLGLERLQVFTGLHMSRVRLRYEERSLPAPSRSGSPLHIWRESKAWNAHLSEKYELFICIGHWMPPFCHARRGALVVLFPSFKPRDVWPLNDRPRGLLDVPRRLRNAYYSWEWDRRIASYHRVISISEFTRTWTKRYWGPDSTIVYPPVDVEDVPMSGTKQRRIVSVGRFASGGHSKRHELLIQAFGALADLRQDGWELDLVGACSEKPEDRRYFEHVKAVADQNGARLLPNCSRGALLATYQSAKIFVHGAGFGEPDDRPEKMEHFGIVTVEAMAAGCVPLVINRGGQPEIVRHGVDGLVWNTVAELQEQLRAVAADALLWQRLSAAAHERARRFDKRRFTSEMRRVLSL